MAAASLRDRARDSLRDAVRGPAGEVVREAESGAGGTALSTPTSGPGADEGAGSPRAQALRREAICAAALDVLLEEGYDRMTMDAVAARARASKATIYRHWAGKQELVQDALRQRGPLPFPLPDTGSLREDLLATLRLVAASMRQGDGALVCGVVGALRTAPDIADTVRRELVDAKRDVSRTIVSRAVARGELPAGVDPEVFHEVAPALVFFRVNVLALPADEDFLARITDQVLIPLMGRVQETTTQSPAPTSPASAARPSGSRPRPFRPELEEYA